MEASKHDWKLYRERLPKWQEAYMEHLVKEYAELLNGTQNASDKFWKLEERIKKDRKHPGVIIEVNKGNMIYDIARLINLDVITEADLEGFSEDLRETISFFQQRTYNI